MVDSAIAELRDKFLGGMSQAACTVNVVTTDGTAGRHGVTVSAMSSVSADTPRPTLLVCVHHLSPAAQKIIDNGVFCVNVLRDDQSFISDTFAGRHKDVVADKFDCADWTEMPSGSPRIVDPLVGFDCRIVSFDHVGTHYVIFGEVSDLFVAERGSPLIYANRAYGAASRIEGVSTIAAGKEVTHQSLSVGCFHTFGPYILPSLIQAMAATNPKLTFNLVEGDQRRVQESLLAGEVELALLYDIDLPGELESIVLTRLKPYVLLAEGHDLAKKQKIIPQDLVDYSMILLNTPPSREYFQSILREAGVKPTIAFRSGNFEMVRGLVGYGLGYALLATKPAAAMTYDGQALTTRPLDCAAAPSRVVIATRAQASLSQVAVQFMNKCRNIFHTVN